LRSDEIERLIAIDAPAGGGCSSRWRRRSGTLQIRFIRISPSERG